MAEYEQSYNNSCGAAALLCAAYELELDHIPQNGDYSLWEHDSIPLALTTACEDRLYQVTSDNPSDENPASWGYSMPSGIVKCARMLGLAARVIAEPTWTVRALKFQYPEEINKLHQIAALKEPLYRCFFGNHSRIQPHGDERELRVLLSWQWATLGQMHYVMIRPDGSVMEPGEGLPFANVRVAKTEVQKHGTGLSVFVRRAI
ncbi:MAG TPA: hypothetical protein VF800_21390 [Telluria sp.]